MTTQEICEVKLARIEARWGDLPAARRISKLDLLALRAFANSPWQRVIQARREAIRKGT